MRLASMDLFFHKVTNFVVDQMGEPFPELEAHRDFIDLLRLLSDPKLHSELVAVVV